jgi:hypothetical protein
MPKVRQGLTVRHLWCLDPEFKLRNNFSRKEEAKRKTTKRKIEERPRIAKAE